MILNEWKDSTLNGHLHVYILFTSIGRLNHGVPTRAADREVKCCDHHRGLDQAMQRVQRSERPACGDDGR